MRAKLKSALPLLALLLAVSLATQFWGYWRERSIGQDLARLAAAGDILMLASDTCTFCSAARLFLHQYEVRFSECSIERDAACAEQFQRSMLQGTPVLVVRGQYQRGFVPERVRDKLAERS